MKLSDKLINRDEKIAIIGLGYVGIPLAVAFSKKIETIGFDVDKEKIQAYRQGHDPTKEVGDDKIRNCSVDFTSDAARLVEAKFHIIAVPTPISSDNSPDLSYVIAASKLLGPQISKSSIVVYESTVYPGVTEDICIPILEVESGLRAGLDFKVGYSPERINPGDRVNRLDTIVKIVAGMDVESIEEIAKVYELIIHADIHRVSSIKVAEAVKVVENSQRDVNIAFMNELAMVFDKMGIDTHEALEAMNTKWNALGFYPGLVGGHCISVDPHYFIYAAEKLGHHSQLIHSSRRINEDMSTFVVDAIIKQLVLAGKVVKNAKVAILGVTYKENCPDIRNSKVIKLIQQLKDYGIEASATDPQAIANEVMDEYGVELVPFNSLRGMDCVVFAIAHDEYKNMPIEKLDAMFADCTNNERVIVDVKSALNKDEIIKKGYRFWRL